MSVSLTTVVVAGTSMARRVRLTRTVGVVSVFFGARGILLLELRSRFCRPRRHECSRRSRFRRFCRCRHATRERGCREKRAICCGIFRCVDLRCVSCVSAYYFNVQLSRLRPAIHVSAFVAALQLEFRGCRHEMRSLIASPCAQSCVIDQRPTLGPRYT
jgi:hypothetical protein